MEELWYKPGWRPFFFLIFHQILAKKHVFVKKSARKTSQKRHLKKNNQKELIVKHCLLYIYLTEINSVLLLI